MCDSSRALPPELRRPPLPAGAQRVGPGIYRLLGGDLHIRAWEICWHLGWEDTPANERRVATALREFAAAALPETDVQEKFY